MGEVLDSLEATRSVAVTAAQRLDGPAPRPVSSLDREGVIDWRTIDEATIRENGILVEELLTFRENIDELLQHGSGQFVLIVGREIVSLFPDLETAASYATERFQGRDVLIKKISLTSPIHTVGGAALAVRLEFKGAIG